jgi:hypothetical protein
MSFMEELFRQTSGMMKRTFRRGGPGRETADRRSLDIEAAIDARFRVQSCRLLTGAQVNLRRGAGTTRLAG